MSSHRFAALRAPRASASDPSAHGVRRGLRDQLMLMAFSALLSLAIAGLLALLLAGVVQAGTQ